MPITLQARRPRIVLKASHGEGTMPIPSIQDFSFARGENLVDADAVQCAVQSAEYANGATVNWRLQVWKTETPGTLVINLASNSVVASGQFPIPLPKATTLVPAVGGYDFAIYDTTLELRLAFGRLRVDPGLVT